jgi:UDP-N-acetylmuramate dehydrogenase
VSIPGTVGGAIYGNAGAHDSDIRNSLALADILHHQNGKATWTSNQLEFGYRTSLLKRNPGQAVVLSARFRLSPSTPDAVHARMEEFTNQRHQSQPTGASMGSMFKNPPGDFAGRLIEAAGLKGTRIGGVEISPVHANFFINDHNAKATDIWKLIHLTQEKVAQKFGIKLELEIELIGNWQNVEATEKAAKKPLQRKQSK